MSKRIRKKLDKRLELESFKSVNIINLNEIKVEDFIKVLIETWRIKKRLYKNESSLSEQLQKGFDFSYEKILWITKNYNIEIKDIHWEKYFEEMNGIEIISAEIDESLSTQVIIKEVIEPIVMLNWKLYRKGKVIIWNK
jgi:hypothetical protein